MTARTAPHLVLAAAAATVAALAGPGVHAQSGTPVRLEVVGDAISVPLTATPGNPARGRAIVMNRQVGLCLLCHRGPFPEEPLQGTIASDLAGAGSRLSEGQLRLRIVDSRQLDADSLMPAYHRVDGLTGVATAYRGKPVLDAQQIEDVVALLKTLR